DGRTVTTLGPAGELPDHSTAIVLDTDVPAGCHVLEARLDYFTRFPTPWGYDYIFRVRSVHAVNVPKDGNTLRIVSDDARGSITTPLEDRFEVRWETP